MDAGSSILWNDGIIFFRLFVDKEIFLIIKYKILVS